ncbi:hypothetical protein J6590_011174 [Homalodisca vitripennis]|nr:hypothetical protein J6590_011174 [Homalodisca vitripennis]
MGLKSSVKRYVLGSIYHLRKCLPPNILFQEVFYNKCVPRSVLKEVFYKKCVPRSVLQEVFYNKCVPRSVLKEVFYKKCVPRSVFQEVCSKECVPRRQKCSQTSMVSRADLLDVLSLVAVEARSRLRITKPYLKTN